MRNEAAQEKITMIRELLESIEFPMASAEQVKEIDTLLDGIEYYIRFGVEQEKNELRKSIENLENNCEVVRRDLKLAKLALGSMCLDYCKEVAEEDI